jgi:hypothetical protein
MSGAGSAWASLSMICVAYMSRADPHDARIRDEFESKWVRLDNENEMRTEPWPPSGVASDVQLAQHLGRFEDWVEGVLADDQTTNHR